MRAHRTGARPRRAETERASERRSPGFHAVRAARLGLGGLCLSILCFAAIPAVAAALPDGRGYEMVTPLDKNAQEVGAGIGSTSGNAVNWEAIGGCCGATSAASTLYQSTRTAGGWQTTPKTPTPPAPLVGLLEEQQPMWWSSDLSKTIYLTPSSYAAGDNRPPGGGSTVYFDLYEQSPSGTLSWLSQGPFPGAGTNPDNATWAATTPDGNSVLFNTKERLTSDATGLASLNTPPEFLYDRNVSAGTTNLVNVATTTLAAPATGQVATTLTSDAVGRDSTPLSAPAGPAVNDALTAATTGAHTTTLTAAATGQLATTLTSDVTAGATTIPVTDSTGFAAGQTINVDGETDTVASVPDGTDITLTTALATAHSSGATVSYGGDTTIAVADTTGFAAGQTITINPGGADQESGIVASLDPTHITLTAGLANSHASGESVSYPGDSEIAISDTSKLAPGEAITIDTGGAQETATIAVVLDATHLQLSGPLANDHPSGAPVTYPGDNSVTVGNASNYSAGQAITIDPGSPQQEAATIASVAGSTITLTQTLTNVHAAGATIVHANPDSSITVASTSGLTAGQPINIGGEAATISAVTDATHLALTGPLTSSHAAGTAVSFAGDTTLTVAGTSAFAAGQNVSVGTGSSQETARIASVPDSTHITLTTPLQNNHDAGAAVEALISPDGAIAGNGNWLDQQFLPANYFGTTTNSISSDGTKVFFESPPTFAGGGGGAEGVGPAHLYMRDLATNTTTPIDDPTSGGQAVFEGASQDGSLAFFTSTEGLGGDANTNNELYEFNTKTGTITSLSNDSANTDPNFVGITAISNDGRYVWFIDKDALPGALGATPNQGGMNFYVYDTTLNTTTFIAALGSGVAGDNRDKTVLAGEPDTARAAIPTPNGNVLVFESTANLTQQNPSGPTTSLTSDTNSETNDQPVSIPVTSSAGFLVGRTIEIVTPSFINESATIMGIPDSTHLLVTDGGIGLFFPHASGDQVIQRPPFEIYRYVTANNSITCVSCTPPGVTPTGSAGLGASGGGTYGPPSDGVPMSSDGSRIFFDSPDPLTPGVISSPPIPIGLFGGLTFVQNVYEWQNGAVSLISDGHSTTGSALGSTTPSGNDVFFTTEDQLVPQDTDGYDDIYDARVGGGFPAPPAPPPACGSADTCRSSVAPTVFFTTPSSSTLVQSNTAPPTFRVNSISAKQRRQFAKTGKLTITVHVSQAGKISAVASAVIKGATETLSSASHSFFATSGGTAKLTLHLGNAARKVLARKHKLVVHLSVSYSESSQINLASLTLTKAKTKKATTRHKATTRRATVRRRARER
jgi:hypothetical protein